MARRVRVRGSRRQVWNGTRQKNKSGLTKSDFMLNKNGRLVSKKQHARGRKQFKNIRGWINAVSKARKALGITGFCAVKKGTPLYIKAREFYCASVFLCNAQNELQNIAKSFRCARSTTKCLFAERTKCY